MSEPKEDYSGFFKELIEELKNLNKNLNLICKKIA